MFLAQRFSIVVCGLLLFTLPVSVLVHAQGNLGRHHMIHLYPKGPRPKTLTVKIGMPVVWQSHLAHTKYVVVTVAFLKGERVAHATKPVEGMNGFDLESGHFVGRMEGSGGMVALKFITPGEYTYSLGHRERLTGLIVVRP